MIEPFKFDIVRQPPGTGSSAENDPGQIIIRAFQDAHAHDINTHYAQLFRCDYATKYARGGRLALSQLTDDDLHKRYEAADDLVAEFEDLSDEIRVALTSTVNAQAMRRVIVRPLYEDTPVVYTSLGFSKLAPAQSISTFLYGGHYINQFGYFLPVHGIPLERGWFRGKSIDPMWFVRVLDSDTGEPLVSLDFPERY